MSLVKKPVLLLNSWLEPIQIITVKRALTMLSKGKVHVVVSSDRQIYPGVFVPSVIRLMENKYIPMRRKIVSRKNILERDGHACQYCGRKAHAGDLTLDHVFPKSRGGKNTWENLVTACHKCNQKKGDLTPQEAGMLLLHRIVPSTVHTSRGMLRSAGLAIKEWAQFLFVDSAGDKKFAYAG